MAAPSQLIKLGHARDQLRQHYAVEAGLEPMDQRPLGSDPGNLTQGVRDLCSTRMQKCRDDAHWEISSLISGSKITVWKERDDGGLEPAGSKWAQRAFDAPGIASHSLYFDKREWECLLQTLVSIESRDFLKSATEPPHADHASACHHDAAFDFPQAEWFELWQGPLQFRATYDKGKFGPGHSLERINQYGQDAATGGGRHAPIYSVRLDPDDGAIVIEWLIGLPGRQPPYQSERIYHGGLGRSYYEKLSDDPTFRHQALAHLPASERARAVGAYACAISIRAWAEREFFQAIHAGQCEIWARVGSKVAPFRRIPADIFRAYEIQSWGHGALGSAWAKLSNAEPLFAIHVVGRAEADGSQAARSKGGRPPEHDWEAMKRLAEAAMREHPGLTSSKLADSLVAEYAAKVSPSAPVKRTIERKLAEWGWVRQN